MVELIVIKKTNNEAHCGTKDTNIEEMMKCMVEHSLL